jgi:lipid II:glycine glycyltransferase (peptidoglycan interpeptide bridge formation enzyme)
MNLKTITPEEFDQYAVSHKHYTFHQHSNWAKVKELTNWSAEYIGFYEDNTLVGATLLLIKNAPLGYKVVYSPRGILVDHSDVEMTQRAYDTLTLHLKSQKAINLIVDPYVIYKTYSSDGKTEIHSINDDVFRMFKKLNFKHTGFNIYFETLQPRWMYRLKLNDYDVLHKNFEKNTKRNLRIASEKGIVVKQIERDQLETFNKILNSTADRRGFINRPLSYYQNMYDSLQDSSVFYIAYLDADTYIENTTQLLKELDAKEEILNHKIETENVGKKLLNEKKQLENQRETLTKKLDEANDLKKKYPNPVPVGSLLSLKSGNEYLSLLSGIDNSFRKFNPKYALYNQHIQDGIENGFEYSNFYGITGDFSKENPNYGIYEFKKGFNGEVNELIGQFEYVCNPIIFSLYQLALTVRKKLRNKK